MKSGFILTVGLVMMVGVVTAGGSTAQVAAVQHDATAVIWSPLVECDGMVLTVSGEDLWVRRQFKAGESPVFGTSDAAGNPLADGLYKWELTPVLRGAVRDRADNGRGRPRTGGGDPWQGEAPLAETQSGWFRIEQGAVADSSLRETDAGFGTGFGGGGRRAYAGDGPVANVVLTNGDGVIRNSSCIGFDCPDSPSFNDSTVLLMENNTRIKFDDTSTIGGFPNNDWQLEANSSLSGGPQRFALHDCGVSAQGGCAEDPVFVVEAGVRANALYVGSFGRIGVGTNSPALNLHVVSGNTPAVRLDQNTSSGFTPQVWDVAGNETNFFIRDATNGSRLPLRIQPNAPSNSIFIKATTGEVGIGTLTPLSPLHVRGNLRMEQTVQDTTSNFRLSHPDQTWLLQNNGTNDDFELRDVTGNATPFAVENGAPAGFFRITAAGQVRVAGVPVHPDYVFEPDYQLESIEEHAEFMFGNKHLPAVGAGLYDEAGRAQLDLVGRSQGVLEELEKAHIYIAQLNERLGLREAAIEELAASGRSLADELAELRRQVEGLAELRTE